MKLIKKKKYNRKLSASERIYLAYNSICPPFSNQLILEGEGQPDINAFRNAIQKASMANPGSRVTIKGFLGTTRLTDSGITPELRVVDGKDWNGKGPDNAPFLHNDISPLNSSGGCEVVIIQGDPQRIAFRTHHSVMDARGTMLWATDIFRVLRNEDLSGSDSTITEPELAATYQKQGRVPLGHDFIAPTGKPEGNDKGVVWQRLSIEGKKPKLLARVAVLLAHEARIYSNGNVRIAVPVDMRFRKKGLLSTGNLTNLIYLDISPETTSDDVVKNIAFQLENKFDGMIYKKDDLIRFAPLFLIKKQVLKEISEKNKTGLYRNSGILSNPGKLSTAQFSGGNFTMKTGFFIPPGQESMPIFIAMSGTDNSIEIVFSIPKVLATNKRMEKLIYNIEQALSMASGGSADGQTPGV